MRNIANFGLWFYFVYVIFRAIFKKDDVYKKVKDILLWILIAWIGIQTSWFFTAAIIDVSTVTLVAAGAFPSQVISENDELQRSIENSFINYLWSDFAEWEKYTLFPSNSKTNWFLNSLPIRLENHKTKEEVFDSIMPQAEDVSWPLHYMWVYIMKTNIIPSVDNSSKNWLKKTILNTIIQWWTTIIYSIEMAVICVLALMRLIYLWMFIILSPIAVLLRCIGKSWEKVWWEWMFSFLWWFTKQINFKSFFINVFKPAIIVLGIWMTVIFVSLMSAVINGRWEWMNDIDLEWVKMSSVKDATTNSNVDNVTYTTSFDSVLFWYTVYHAGKTIMDFILSIITIILVYFVIKIAVSIWDWKDFVSSKIWKLQESIEWMMTSIPVVPVPWYDEFWSPTTSAISLGSTLWIWWRSSVLEQKMSNVWRKIDLERSKQSDEVMKIRWVNWGSLTQTVKEKISQAWVKEVGLNKLSSKLKVIKSENISWMDLTGKTENSRFWIWQFESWLTGMNGTQISWSWNDAVWNEMIKWWNADENKDNRNLEKMFNKVKNSSSVYANFFELWDNVVDWFSSIRDLDISKKE